MAYQLCIFRCENNGKWARGVQTFNRDAEGRIILGGGHFVCAEHIPLALELFKQLAFEAFGRDQEYCDEGGAGGPLG